MTAKLICAGLTFKPETACPVPLKTTVAAFTPRVDEVTVSVAVLPPAEAGVKIAWTVQLLPLASVAPQVLAPVEKLFAQGPVIWKPTLAMGAPPVLLIVSVWGEEATPVCCVGKLRLGGLTAKAGGSSPVPARAMVCFFKMSVTVRTPGCDPAAVGAKVTLSEQLELAASCVPQVLAT